ncbi:hypothetical protein BOTBODRAFT_104720, partial [Botryobasidium botryosum FD-172 SS1]
YLPEAVLEVLNDATLEAAKRAAMVTTALKWLLDNVPTTGVPPPVGLALTLLSGIIPLLGYIGGFVAWSWSSIKGYDEGDGIILSATWLLPMVLIPGTWEDPDAIVAPASLQDDANPPTPPGK